MMTTSDIARECGVPRHRVVWALTSRRIDPDARIGTAFVYSDEAFARVRSALTETAQRSGRAAG